MRLAGKGFKGLVSNQFAYVGEPTGDCRSSRHRGGDEVGARTVAFPAVSAGVYGWDPGEVARIAVEATRTSPVTERLELVRFVLFSEDVLEEFRSALGDLADQ